jgi:hypothetical protein
VSEACPFCGGDARRVVAAQWRFFIPRQATSMNAHRQNDARGHAYRKERDRWEQDLRAHGRATRLPWAPPAASAGIRRVTLLRLFCGRQRELDYGNLVGGLKPVLDAMVRSGWLLDDSPAYCEDHYLQRRHDMLSGIEFTVEDLLP